MGSRILACIQPVRVLAQSDTLSLWQTVQLFQEKKKGKKHRTPKQPEYSLKEKGTCGGPGGKTEKSIQSV